MPRPRKHKDSGTRYDAFIDRHLDYQKSDRVKQSKREWYRRNAPECPRCNLCGARLKSERNRALLICRNCQRAQKQQSSD